MLVKLYTICHIYFLQYVSRADCCGLNYMLSYFLFASWVYIYIYIYWLLLIKWHAAHDTYFLPLVAVLLVQLHLQCLPDLLPGYIALVDQMILNSFLKINFTRFCGCNSLLVKLSTICYNYLLLVLFLLLNCMLLKRHNC